MRIFVDTAVWRHWFCFRAKRGMKLEIVEHSKSFQRIYEHAQNSSSHRFLYNRRVLNELGQRFTKEFQDYVIPLAEPEIPIPLTRSDGIDLLDGSTLCGGKWGGALRCMLTLDGYKQEDKIKIAATEDRPLYETNARRREFDIEHMESALEAKADFFLTDDESCLDLINRAIQRYKNYLPIVRIHTIAGTPTSKLDEILSRQN